MSRLPFLLLGFLGAALTATILLELGLGRDQEMVLPEAAPRAPAAAGAVLVQPSRAAGPSEWMAAVLARPLFHPDRRPPVPGTADRPAGAALPRLTGTMVTADGRRAIFAGGGAPLVVQEGAQVGAFTVVLIAPGEVTLMGPDGMRAVRPSFDPGRSAGSATAGAVAGVPVPPGPVQPARQSQPIVSATPPADPLTGRLSIGPSPEAGGAAEGAVTFEQRTTPSGLDILQRNSRSAPPGAGAVP